MLLRRRYVNVPFRSDTVNRSRQHAKVCGSAWRDSCAGSTHGHAIAVRLGDWLARCGDLVIYAGESPSACTCCQCQPA
jgi:hypothetical protein